MSSSDKTVVWFRRDLRIEDNPALAAAARDAAAVLPVFIWCPDEEAQFYPGRVSRWWLKQSLAHLDRSLRSLGSPLVLIRSQSTLAALLQCLGAIGATKVLFNHLYGTQNRQSLFEIVNYRNSICELKVHDSNLFGSFEESAIVVEKGSYTFLCLISI